MFTEKIQAVILAAGKSTRFKSNRSKLLEPLCGQPMLVYPVKLLAQLQLKTSLVVGYQKAQIINLLTDHPQTKNLNLEFITQTEQLGTGHALQCTEVSWDREHVLILNGDVPLITPELITQLAQQHLEQQATASFVIAHNIDPEINNLGRIFTIDQQIKIIEAKDYAQNQAYYQSVTTPVDGCCINVGIYLFKTSFLRTALPQLQKSSVTGEIYITDLVNLASAQNLNVQTVTGNFDTLRGINTMRELWIAEQLKRAEIINYWMEQGVRFFAPQNTHVDLAVTIGAGSYIGAGVELYGATTIGQNCQLGSYCIIKDSVLPDQTILKPFSYLQHKTRAMAPAKAKRTTRTAQFVAAKQTTEVYQN